jgi:hypothetical protein
MTAGDATVFVAAVIVEAAEDTAEIEAIAAKISSPADPATARMEPRRPEAATVGCIGLSPTFHLTGWPVSRSGCCDADICHHVMDNRWQGFLPFGVGPSSRIPKGTMTLGHSVKGCAKGRRSSVSGERQAHLDAKLVSKSASQGEIRERSTPHVLRLTICWA